MRHPWPVAVLQRNVNISIGVHTTLPTPSTKIVPEADACVYQKEYTFIGVTSISCKRFIKGRHVSIEFVRSTTLALCEIEVFAREYPTSIHALLCQNCGTIFISICANADLYTVLNDF